MSIWGTGIWDIGAGFWNHLGASDLLIASPV